MAYVGPLVGRTSQQGAIIGPLAECITEEQDHSILTDILEPSDVDRVLRIPISPDYEDSWFWYGDPRGCYTVKGGYRSMVGDYETLPTNFDRWSPFWKIKVPPKWKTFLRRALSDILLVTTNLLKKRVEVDPSCPMCGIVHEDVMHSLVLCDFTQLVWHESCLAFSSIMGGNFSLWFTNLLCSLSEDHVCWAVAILYHVWKARNDAVWSGYLPTPRRVVAAAKASLQAWTAVRQRHPPVGQSEEVGGAVQPAQASMSASLVCYFDASYNPVTLKAAFGAVLFDPGGNYVAAIAGPMIDCFSPLMAETIACKEVLAWLRDRGVDSIRIFTDCSQLCSGLSRPHSPYFSYVGLYIDACKSAIACFLFCHINLVHRSMNIIAHTLAAAAVQQASRLHWDSVPPDFILAHL
ncbi:uncharacterized protein LOC116001340 [Ipomoea triloba]|uniref:uncharacterized protein LOC116001340 n=1 Tax=Ipomoea triloba TaxID=35885 RepID=UPI00125E8B04|nr:uncharacterized protein LOC116001340 [Ipomoea triloba]